MTKGYSGGGKAFGDLSVISFCNVLNLFVIFFPSSFFFEVALSTFVSNLWVFNVLLLKLYEIISTTSIHCISTTLSHFYYLPMLLWTHSRSVSQWKNKQGWQTCKYFNKKKWFLKTNAIQSTGFSETDMVINTNWSDYFIDENMRFCAFKSLYCNGVMVCNALNIYIVNNSTNMQMLQVSCDFLPIVKHWGCPTFTWPKYALDF